MLTIYVIGFEIFDTKYYLMYVKGGFFSIRKRIDAFKSLKYKLIMYFYNKDGLYNIDRVRIKTKGLNDFEKSDVLKTVKTEVKHFYCDFFSYFVEKMKDIPNSDVQILNKHGYYVIDNITIE